MQRLSNFSYGALFVTIAISFALNEQLGAKTLRVPSEYPNIQNGIDSSGPGDTVLVADGIYSGEGNREINSAGKLVIVLSENGPESTIIELMHSYRGFIFNSSESRKTVLKGFTIQNGSHRKGAGIFCTNSSPTIANCILRNNTAGASREKGVGGGMYCGTGSSPRVINCLFIGNSAMLGGGLMIESTASPRIVQSKFIENSCSKGSGGAVAIADNSSPEFSSCTFRSNWAKFGGGAVLSTGGSKPDIYWSLIVRNSTLRGGGGAFDCRDSSDLGLVNCTIALNRGNGENASGVHLTGTARARLVKSIVAYGTSGPAVSAKGKGYRAYAFCSNVFGNSGGDWVGPVGAFFGTNDNISSDPMFCDTLSDKFGLHFGSPCTQAVSVCNYQIGYQSVKCYCCSGIVGNVNDDPMGIIDISDLTYLVSWIIGSGADPPCRGEADINGDLAFTMADAMSLAGYMFNGEPELADCP